MSRIPDSEYMQVLRAFFEYGEITSRMQARSFLYFAMLFVIIGLNSWCLRLISPTASYILTSILLLALLAASVSKYVSNRDLNVPLARFGFYPWRNELEDFYERKYKKGMGE